MARGGGVPNRSREGTRVTFCNSRPRIDDATWAHRLRCCWWSISFLVASSNLGICNATLLGVHPFRSILNVLFPLCCPALSACLCCLSSYHFRLFLSEPFPVELLCARGVSGCREGVGFQGVRDLAPALRVSGRPPCARAASNWHWPWWSEGG